MYRGVIIFMKIAEQLMKKESIYKERNGQGDAAKPK